jgi:hypothetical protein
LLLFSGKSTEAIREITFEIGMLGKYVLDINDPKSRHVLRSLLVWTFLALQMVLTCHKRSNVGFSQ